MPNLTLPVDAHRPAFDQAVQAHARVVLEAPTGSGKSTRLPLWLAALTDRRVIVLEPRRLACVALARFLASQDGSRVGARIGYRVRFDDQSGPDTRVLFVTPGVLVRMFRDPSFAPGAILFDEFHERGTEADLAATFARARQEHDPALRLVYTSATLDAAALVDALGAHHIAAPGRQFPVALRHEDAPFGPSRRDLDRRAAAVTRRALDEHDGDVLVFLPGRGEIRDVARALSPTLPRGVELIEVHGGKDVQKLARAFEQHQRRRVYLATNVAETSLTLPGVRVVVDSGLERGVLHIKKRSALALMPCAESSLEQRKGRAGRVAPGLCIRLFSSRYVPKPTKPPEIERVPLDDLALQLAAVGYDKAAAAALRWPTPPPDFALERAQEKLAALGLLDDQGAITALGRAAAERPVSADVGPWLVDPPAGLLPLCAAMATLVETGDRLVVPLSAVPAGRRDDVADERRDAWRGCGSEAEECLRALCEAGPDRLGLHPRTFADARRLYQRLAGRPPDENDLRLTDRRAHELAVFLATRAPLRAYALRARAAKKRDADRAPYGNDNDEVSARAYQPPGDAAGEGIRPEAGIVLSSGVLVDDKGRVFESVRLMFPCTRRALVEAGLGTVRVRPDGATERVYAGVVLEVGEEKVAGETLLEAVARDIAAGRRFKKLAPRLDEALFHWALCAALHEGVAGPSTTEIEPFLVERLTALGVETEEDLKLVDAADLLPDVPTVTGLFDAAEKVAADFPRTLRLDGGGYRLEVFPARQEAWLVPDDAQAKKKKQPPPAQLCPRVRGYALFFKKASKRVRIR